MGATACGKTDLSLMLARQLDAEIISVDSALVYRGLDIGTAKPSEAQRQGIPHHLIDVCDPWQSYSAALFCADASQLIARIRDRGKRVLLVGGTMLYFKALEEGLATLPEADSKKRDALHATADACGWPALHQQLASVDPDAARRIHPNDPQRIVRALEVYEITGTPMSILQSKTQSLLDVPVLKYARIEQRFNMMIEQGFLEEVQSLFDHPKTRAALPAMRSVGYRQAWQYISDDKQDDQWMSKAIAATRQLAKRQLTWLRGMSNLTSIACNTLSVEDQASVILTDFGNHS
jgi:tRNA dimethylallyltransferase